MIPMELYLAFLPSLIFTTCVNAQPDDFPILKGPFLGQKPPGEKPEIFAPGIISTEAEEFGCCFSPDGTEFYFTRITVDSELKQRRMTIMYSRLSENGWLKPERAPFCGDYAEGEPNFSPVGDFVLYGRLLKSADGSDDPRIIISERKENGWGKPRELVHGMFSSITNDGVIYYTDVSRGYSNGKICRARFKGENDPKPEILSGKINSTGQDAHPFVTPEGDMLIFDSNRAGGYGDNDLYISFRRDDGGWGDPVNMGPVVNTDKYDAIPYLSYDRKYLFFFRDKDIYWVDAGFIENLRAK